MKEDVRNKNLIKCPGRHGKTG